MNRTDCAMLDRTDYEVHVQVIKAWYATLPSEMQQVMESQAGKPYTTNTNALPRDSRAPAEISARAHSRAAVAASKHRHCKLSRLERRSCFHPYLYHSSRWRLWNGI